VRYLGGRVLSLEHDPETAAAWRQNVSEAGLEGWVDLVEGDALETLPGIDDVFDVVFIDARKDEYEAYFTLARERVEPGGLIVADNVLSHQDELAAYCEARRADPGLLTVTVPLDRGLELTVVLTDSPHPS
jgi:caffeoyl-CoA O-methyltransferase